MDRELEDQIEDLIIKATKDLKTRISRIVVRHQTKLLKEQARGLKSASVAPRKTSTATSSSVKTSKKDSKYHSDSGSDSDDYY